MTSTDLLPDDPESLKRLLLAREGELVVARAQAATVMAEVATLRAKATDDEALIAHLKLQNEKLNRDRFGQRPNAAPACSINSNCSSRSWKPQPPKMNLPQRLR